MDLFAYIGTVILLGASLFKKRVNLHLARIVGNLLWLIYAIYIFNIPLIITEIIAALMDIIAIILYRNDQKK